VSGLREWRLLVAARLEKVVAEVVDYQNPTSKAPGFSRGDESALACADWPFSAPTLEARRRR